VFLLYSFANRRRLPTMASFLPAPSISDDVVTQQSSSCVITITTTCRLLYKCKILVLILLCIVFSTHFACTTPSTSSICPLLSCVGYTGSNERRRRSAVSRASCLSASSTADGSVAGQMSGTRTCHFPFAEPYTREIRCLDLQMRW
jgi:hypothetical protein